MTKRPTKPAKGVPMPLREAKRFGDRYMKSLTSPPGASSMSYNIDEAKLIQRIGFIDGFLAGRANPATPKGVRR